MRAPNGQQFFPSHDNWEATFTSARDVLGRCSEHFENAVEGTPLKFKLHTGDGAVLSILYGEHVEFVTGQFFLFANHVLDAMRMPYRLSSVGCVVTNCSMLYCSVRRETFDEIKKRIGEVS